MTEIDKNGVDDIESWISLLNAEEAEEFTHDLDAFFSDDILDSDLDINFENPIDKVAQRGMYLPHQLDSRERAPASILQISQSAYGFVPRASYGLSDQPPRNPQLPSAPAQESSLEQYPQVQDVFSSIEYRDNLPYSQSQHAVSNEIAQRGMYLLHQLDSRERAPASILQISQSAYGFVPRASYGLSDQPPRNPQLPSAPAQESSLEQYPQVQDVFSSIEYRDNLPSSQNQHAVSNEIAQRGMYLPHQLDSRERAPASILQISQSAYGFVPRASYGLSDQPPRNPQLPSAPAQESSLEQYPQVQDVFSSIEYRDHLPYSQSQHAVSNEINDLVEAIKYYKAEDDQEKQFDEEVPSPKSHPLLISHRESFAERNIINILKSIPILELYGVLQSLKFQYVIDLFDCISHLFKKNLEIEICQTCAKILTNFNLERLLSSKQHHQILIDLKDLLFGSKMPLIIKPRNDIDIGSSSETSSIKEPRMRYSGWKWVENKDQTKKLSDSVKVDVNTYFPVLSSSSTLGDETHVTEHHDLKDDAKEQTIECSCCSYKKTPEDSMDFFRAECGHIYCRPCSNWLFSKRNPVKPHICCKCGVIIKKFRNRPVFHE